jgi:hypothetical protein
MPILPWYPTGMEENPYKAPLAADVATTPLNQPQRQFSVRRFAILLLIAFAGAVIGAVVGQLFFPLMPPA